MLETVIFVTWDDWGGFYDHVEPPVVERWKDGTSYRSGWLSRPTKPQSSGLRNWRPDGCLRFRTVTTTALLTGPQGPMARPVINTWEPMRQALASDSDAQKRLRLNEDDFLYFSHSGRYEGPPENPCNMPCYSCLDSTRPDAVTTAARHLDEPLRRFPDAQLDIVALITGR